MVGFGEITVPVKVEFVVPEGVVPERYAAWATAARLLREADFRGSLPSDVLTLAAFLAGDAAEEPEDDEVVDLSEVETELAEDEPTET